MKTVVAGALFVMSKPKGSAKLGFGLANTTLRRLLTDKLAGQPGKLPKDYKERTEQVNNKLKSGEIEKWIEVVRDLTHRKEQDSSSKVDQRLLKRAMHLLAGELAMAQGIDPEEAESHLASFVERRHELKDQQADTLGLSF